jgi:hypothetical protein
MTIFYLAVLLDVQDVSAIILHGLLLDDQLLLSDFTKVQKQQQQSL